jgi:hypothetical protein
MPYDIEDPRITEINQKGYPQWMLEAEEDEDK